jgi:hypothetical protein
MESLKIIKKGDSTKINIDGNEIDGVVSYKLIQEKQENKLVRPILQLEIAIKDSIEVEI